MTHLLNHTQGNKEKNKIKERGWIIIIINDGNKNKVYLGTKLQEDFKDLAQKLKTFQRFLKEKKNRPFFFL